MRSPTALALAALLTLPACFVDGQEACGENQVLDDEGGCTCQEGYALDGQRVCVALGSDGEQDAGVADSGPPDSGTETATAGPTGLGVACTTHDDCAGYDASFCDNFHFSYCLIPACTIDPESCPQDWECCDLSIFGVEELLCVPANTCPTR